MRKKYFAVLCILALSLSACGSAGDSTPSENSVTDTTDSSSEAASSETAENASTAISMQTTGNSAATVLSGKDIIDPETMISWVKVATIWDPELTIYSADSFAQGSKAIAVTFEVSDMDLDSMKCYWNYMVFDSEDTEISCWDENYKTDDIVIEEDGKYQMVFDYSKVEGGDVAGLKSLQLVFPEMKEDTKTTVTLLDAKCIMDESEIGTIYQSGKLDE